MALVQPSDGISSDRDHFIRDYQKILIEHPDLLSVPTRRYIRDYFTRVTQWETSEGIEKPLTGIQIEILNFLSKSPEESFYAKEIAPEIVEAANFTSSGGSFIAKTLTTLRQYGYIEAIGSQPFLYKITVKGLKKLNKIIGDYD